MGEGQSKPSNLGHAMDHAALEDIFKAKKVRLTKIKTSLEVSEITTKDLSASFWVEWKIPARLSTYSDYGVLITLMRYGEPYWGAGGFIDGIETSGYLFRVPYVKEANGDQLILRTPFIPVKIPDKEIAVFVHLIRRLPTYQYALVCGPEGKLVRTFCFGHQLSPDLLDV